MPPLLALKGERESSRYNTRVIARHQRILCCPFRLRGSRTARGVTWGTEDGFYSTLQQRHATSLSASMLRLLR